MNKKIFTLLASTLMLFSTAFTANAKIIGGTLAVGDTVRTLPEGRSLGMYHIQIDSIYISGTGWRAASSSASPISGTALTDTIKDGDIVVVGVREDGRVVPVSATSLRLRSALTSDYIDLQTIMWCTNIVRENDPYGGQWPTFHFTNKALGEDLDFTPGNDFVGSNGEGWRYSNSFENGLLNDTRPITRKSVKSGHTVVLVYDPTNKVIKSLETTDAAVYTDTVPGMLKFTILEVAPVVLDATAFNTRLGQNVKNELIQLYFNPAPSDSVAYYPNYFGKKLKAVPATLADAANPDQYLNVLIDGIPGNYIYNVRNFTKKDDDRYVNALGVEHIKIIGDGKFNPDNDNKAYRFVYFPSKDSMVINALRVGHYDQSGLYYDQEYADSVALTGTGNYLTDTGTKPFYYGLYNEMIHDALIVRRQDLDNNKSRSIMVIGKYPANTRISFGINGCEEIEIDAWTPDNGIYTIWDEQGRCLGVRVYNGSLTPQWMELKDIEGECPDRIPSYQWVITKSEGKTYNHRVNIANREFGNSSDLAVNIKNVLIKSVSYQIFRGKGQFSYAPISTHVEQKYVPAQYGWVIGRYIDVVDETDCTVEGLQSGFRPVNNGYVSDQYLGYKHFYVDTDPNSVSFGKSEDVVGMGNMTEKGMDYNAFAFNYYHQYGDHAYIDLKTNYKDTMLHVNPNGGKEGFQFMLGADLNKSSTFYATEKYGVPTKATDYTIDMTEAFGKKYEQNAPVLERYYYELKVADFYGYRDGLREEFVILKGAYGNESDINNKLKYGVADTMAQSQPFKYANVYLRDTYFIPKTKGINEERKSQDPSRRIYYTIMDRIEQAQLQRVTAQGLEVSDTIMSLDASSRAYNLVIWRVDDTNEWIKAQGKPVSSVRLSTFALENMNYPLYRRLCSIEDDGASDNSDGAAMPYDAPKTLRFYTQLNNQEYLYEDALSGESANKGGINFLGLANAAQYKENEIYPDGTKKFNYNIFVDTAYINRGTGWIKPQYLLAVDVEVVNDPEPQELIDLCGDADYRALRPYVVGRYLVNATDSARELGSNGAHAYPIRDDRYIYSTSWDRLIFVNAIHADDRLYLVDQFGFSDSLYTITTREGKKFIDAQALYNLTLEGGLLHGKARRPQHSGMLGAYYDFEEWQNYHNDVSFSLRFNRKDATNASEFDGRGGSINDVKSFRIESETTQRNPYGNRKIAPVQGGWVKIDNGAAVLSRTTYKDAIEQSEIFNVEKGTGIATDNGTVDAPGLVNIIGGIGEVTVLNANGKNLTITNALGQTIATKVLDSDNATVKCSKGIVFVSVLGEKTVKSIVK